MRRLLFVDDEPGFLAGVKLMLAGEAHRWELAFAESGEAALAQMRDKPADIVISDMRMSPMDGADLLGRVQREHPSTVRFIFTGHEEQAASLRALGVAHQFLVKPCSAPVLIDTLERACAVRDLTVNDSMKALMGKIVALPGRPEIHSMIVQRLRDPNVTSDSIADVVERDIAMVAKMLQLANSGFFGLPRRITRLSDAVGFLGYRMIENLAFSLAVFDTGRKLGGVDAAALQRHALHTGVIARALVSDPRLADDAFLAGMLHDLGIYIAAVHLPDYFSKAVAMQEERQIPLHEAEQELFGVSHPALGGYLLGLWNLPLPVVEAVVMHHKLEPGQRYGELVPAVHVADVFAHELAGASCPVERDHPPTLNMQFLAASGMAGKLDAMRERAQDALVNREEAA